MTTQEPLAPFSNLPEYSVSEISQAVRQTLQSQFERICVRGEISSWKLNSGSGHLYLTLKDQDCALEAVCWKTSLSKLRHKGEVGLEVRAVGRITTYAGSGQSRYQLVIESMEPAGAGALMALIEERRKRLTAEGLFDAARKKKLPYLPAVIGIVTSPTGAVIRDILHRLRDRFPRPVLLWPVRVQGEGAAAEIAAAIAGFNAIKANGAVSRPDLLIVARGGGSIEDLAAFNEEIVVRAIAGSVIPVICGVGHETDTSLADFAADLRAPTPTAAAELAVPVRAELMRETALAQVRMGDAILRMMRECGEKLTGLSRGLVHPERLLDMHLQRLDDLSIRFQQTRSGYFLRAGQQIATLAARLPSPKESLLLKEQQLAQPREALSRALHWAIDRAARDLTGMTARLTIDVMDRFCTQHAQTLRHTARLLENLSYETVLKRGFALVRDAASETPLTEARQIQPGQRLHLQFHDGVAEATGGVTAKPPRQKNPAPPIQDKLL